MSRQAAIATPIEGVIISESRIRQAAALDGALVAETAILNIAADAGTFALTGYAAGYQLERRLYAEAGTVTLTGQAARLVAPRDRRRRRGAAAFETDGDRAAFFDATATYTMQSGQVLDPVSGQHDRPQSLQAMDQADEIVTTASFICRTRDLDDSAGQGDSLSVDGFDYLVRARQDDGTGLTRLDLEDAYQGN